MKTAFSRAFTQMMERPVWQQWGMQISGVLTLLGLLYFLMLKTPLQQLQQEQQRAAILRESVSGQQRRLLTQPSLAALLRQQATFASGKTVNVTLMEKIAGPLRQSASTLVQWQPEQHVPVGAGGVKDERGRLTLQSDFKGLLSLMGGLLDDPAAPFFSQLQLHAEKSFLNITFSLAAENITSAAFLPLLAADAVGRDPFSSMANSACSDTHDAFSEVILGGVVGDTEHHQGWVLWPGRGWQKVAVGWRDELSGWQAVAVESAQISFDLQQPPCAARQHTLALHR